MSLENFWPQSFDKMGRTRGNRDKKDSPSESGEDTQDGNRAESEVGDGLDPALAKALNVMTTNIIKVIDIKLSPLAETVRKHATDLQTASKRLDEAETRLSAAENCTTAQEPRIVELEKQVSALTESLDMAENYSRCLNIRVVCLAEGMETGQLVEFFESWLPRVLKLAALRWKEHTAPLHQGQTQTRAPGPCCYDSMRSETSRGLWKRRAGPARMVA